MHFKHLKFKTLQSVSLIIGMITVQVRNRRQTNNELIIVKWLVLLLWFSYWFFSTNRKIFPRVEAALCRFTFASCACVLMSQTHNKCVFLTLESKNEQFLLKVIRLNRYLINQVRKFKSIAPDFCVNAVFVYCVTFTPRRQIIASLSSISNLDFADLQLCRLG